MAYNSNVKKSFTFLWILENFEYCGQKTNQLLKSPTFFVDTIEKTKWSLGIYPRGDKSEKWISLFLNREKNSKGPSTIKIDFELAFLASDGSILQSLKVYKQAYMKNQNWGFSEFQERESVFVQKSTFLPKNVLTIRCTLWRSSGEIKKDGQCIARTLIGVEKKAFLWKIHDFSTFDVEKEVLFRLKSTSEDEPIMSLTLSLKNSSVSSPILIKFVPSNKSFEFSTFKSSVVDILDNYVDCGQHEFWFSPTIPNEEFTLSISKETLVENKGLYLPNDALVLKCEQIFSTGSVYQGIESTTYGHTDSFITNNVIPKNIKIACVKKSDSDTSSDLKADLSSMFQDNILWDVKLCTGSETFPAHWFILTARSPVFRAMFNSDMKEKEKDRIDIVDLKPDTVRRMLLYMYTDSLEELQWETASDLYVATEKYQILALKNKCSFFLKANISFTNACEMLLLADLHQDEKLKSVVQDFILKNDKSIINSNEWKILMETNVHLAAETMLLRFKE